MLIRASHVVANQWHFLLMFCQLMWYLCHDFRHSYCHVFWLLTVYGGRRCVLGEKSWKINSSWQITLCPDMISLFFFLPQALLCIFLPNEILSENVEVYIGLVGVCKEACRVNNAHVFVTDSRQGWLIQTRFFTFLLVSQFEEWCGLRYVEHVLALFPIFFSH